MAKGLIIDDDYGHLALRYYRLFYEEPYSKGNTIIVENPSLIRRTSLDTTLQAILDSFQAKDFEGPDILLVSHGNERGLTMRLFPGHRTDMRTDNLNTLMNSDLSTDDIAKRLFITNAQVNSLLAKMNSVRALNIGSVEFRGCRIGAMPQNLTTLRDLLGANSVSGTDVLSDYGRVDPDIVKREATMDNWLTKFAGSVLIAGLQGGRVGFKIVPHPHKADLRLVAESEDAVAQFLRWYISNNAPGHFESWMRHNLPLHYLKIVPPIVPLAGQTPFTGPIAAPSDDYLNHIQRI